MTELKILTGNTLPRGVAWRRATMKAPVKKKWTHSAWQQTGKGSAHGSGMGSNKNQKYLLFGKIPSPGSKTGQKTRPDSRRTFDPEFCLSYHKRKSAVQETWRWLSEQQNRSKTEKLSEKGIGKIRLSSSHKSLTGSRINPLRSEHQYIKDRFLLTDFALRNKSKMKLVSTDKHPRKLP